MTNIFLNLINTVNTSLFQNGKNIFYRPVDNSSSDSLEDLAHSFDEIGEIFSRFDPKIWIVVAVVFLIVIIEAILALKGYLRFESRNAKRVKEAEKKGHVVTAQLYRQDSTAFKDPNETNTATYLYKVGDKEYKFFYSSHDYPTETLTLYYLDNPKKAFFRGPEYVNLGCIAAFIPLAVGVALAFLLGVNLNY